MCGSTLNKKRNFRNLPSSTKFFGGFLLFILLLITITWFIGICNVILFQYLLKKQNALRTNVFLSHSAFSRISHFIWWRIVWKLKWRVNCPELELELYTSEFNFPKFFKVLLSCSSSWILFSIVIWIFATHCPVIYIRIARQGNVKAKKASWE